MAMERYMQDEEIAPEQNDSLHDILRGACPSTNEIGRILRMGVSIHSVHLFFGTPLQAAVTNENCSLDVIRYLLNNGASVHVSDCNKFPLHSLVHCNNRHKLDITLLLLEYGAEVDQLDFRNHTPLHHAVMGGTPDKGVIGLLLDRGANINALDYLHNSPLCYALQYNNSHDIVKFLLDRGANIHMLLEDETQSLHHAAQNCNPNIVKLLLNYGAQLNVLDRDKFSPLWYSVMSNKKGVPKILLDSGALISCGKHPLGTPTHWNNFDWKDADTLENVQLFLKYGLFENAALGIADTYTSFNIPAKLIDYRKECLREIHEMQCVSIDDTMLPQFLFRWRKELKHKQKEDINFISDKLMHIIYTNAFPLYNEVVHGVINREYLTDKLENLTVFTVSNQHDPFSGVQNSVILHNHVLLKLIRYISKVDLLNLVLAYYNYQVELAGEIQMT